MAGALENMRVIDFTHALNGPTLGARADAPSHLDGLRDLGYFGASVLSLGEVIDDPHVKARGAFVERAHPRAGATKLVAPWIRLSETPASIHADAPGLGEHTDQVLGDLLGLGSMELSELRAQGVVK